MISGKSDIKMSNCSTRGEVYTQPQAVGNFYFNWFGSGSQLNVIAFIHILRKSSPENLKEPGQLIHQPAGEKSYYPGTKPHYRGFNLAAFFKHYHDGRDTRNKESDGNQRYHGL